LSKKNLDITFTIKDSDSDALLENAIVKIIKQSDLSLLIQGDTNINGEIELAVSPATDIIVEVIFNNDLYLSYNINSSDLSENGEEISIPSAIDL